MPKDESPSPQQLSPSYVLAEKDVAFLARPELRPVRLQLELLKPELSLAAAGVHSTIVVWGSARIPAPDRREEALERARRSVEAHPEDPHRELRLNAARRLVEKSAYYEAARRFGALVAQNCRQQGDGCDAVIVTGGGPGIMEAANRGALEQHAQSVGLNITLPFEQEPNRYITPALCFNFHYFAIRKLHFLLRAKALVCFPGGFGTMDELFEVLTLIQTRKMKPIPVLLFGRAYWERVIRFDVLVEEGTIAPEDLELFDYVDRAEDAWQRIEDFYREPPPPRPPPAGGVLRQPEA